MVKKIIRRLKHELNVMRCRNHNKVFCIGRNKTGTTSVSELFSQLGIPVGRQRTAELLAPKLKENNYRDLIKYVKNNGVAFQDVPFSMPNVYKILDKEFPNSKFILTVRDSPEVWYHSLTTFHAKVFGNGKIPQRKELENVDYVYRGWSWEMNRLRYNTPEDDVYNKEVLIKDYIDYNNEVEAYFKDRPEQLLIVNLKEPDAAVKISKFLGSDKIIKEIPWENKT